jgi:type IX secretion system PorP/SprF family membrane protein
MRNFYTIVFVLAVLGFYTNSSFAQQDAQYTQYMYNTLSINPAYAGSRDVFSFVGLYRSQWVGLEGAPKTISASVHSPFGEKIGLGLNVTNDEIFITKETYIDIDFSYTIDLSGFLFDYGKLAFGVKGGGHLLDINFSETSPFNPGDPDADLQPDIKNKFSPQFGAGIFYYSDRFYLGVSAPNFLETEHFDESSNDNNSSSTAKERVNYYIMSGYIFDLDTNIRFKPALLAKIVDGSPLQFDLSANFMVYDKFTFGASYRLSSAISGMVGFQVTDQIMLGFAYDSDTTELKQFNDGSYEFFLRFELFRNIDKMTSPRFF